MAQKPLPHSRDAERAVLGCILIDPDLYPKAAGIITERDFYHEAHRRIWSAIASLRGQQIDILTVSERLASSGELERSGGRAYLAGLVDEIPALNHVTKYARIVRQNAVARAVVAEATKLSTAAMDGGEPIVSLAATSAHTLALLSRDAEPLERTRTVAEMSRAALRAVEERIAKGESISGVATGWRPLDDMTLGIPRGVLSILGARPSVGKTAVALSIAVAAAERGQRVIVYELDMSEAMVGDRLLSLLSGVDHYKIRTGVMLDDAELRRLQAAAAKLADLNDRLVFNHRSREIGHVVADVRRESRHAGLDLVMIDHIGHVRGGQGEKRYLQIGDVSASLIDVAGETGVSMLALAQLNRQAADAVPSMSELRESGNLEQDARVIMLLDRPHYRDEMTPRCRLDFILAKNEGECGCVSMHFDLARQIITEHAERPCGYCVIREVA